MVRLGLNLVGPFQPLRAAALPPICSHRPALGQRCPCSPPPSPRGLCKSPIPPGSCPGPSGLPASIPAPASPGTAFITSSSFTSAPAPPLLHPFMYPFAPQKSSSARSFSCFSLLLPLSGAAGGRLSHRLSLLPRQPFQRPSADYQNFSLGCSKV